MSEAQTTEQILAAMPKSAMELQAEETKPAATEVVETAPTEIVEPPSESETEETEEAEVEQEAPLAAEDDKKEVKGVEKRINKLVKQRSDAQREAQYWRDEALRLKTPAQVEPVKPTAQASSSQDGMPKAADFTTHEEYVLAVGRWSAKEAVAAYKQEQNESAVKTQQQTQVDTFQSRREEAAKKHADFEDVWEEIGDVPVPGHLQAKMLKEGPEFVYQLGKNAAEYKRVMSLPYEDAVEAIAEFKAGLKSSKPSEVKTVQTTKAPAPLKPVGSHATGAVKKDIYDPGLSFKEFAKLRDEQEKRKRA